MKNKIIVPTDLTAAATQAIRQAAIFARKTNSRISLLHVLDKKSESEEEVRTKMELQASEIFGNDFVQWEILIREGNLFDCISYVVCEKDYDLMIIGTHGIRGVRQLFFGADMLKLLLKVSIPVFVVQEKSPLIESLHKTVLPVSSHSFFQDEIDVLLQFSKTEPLEVHLYSIYKAGFPWSDQLLKNIELATSQFEQNQVSLVRVKEDQTVFSMGYAKQTLKYAHSVNADVLCMITVQTEESHYFAQTDKEALLFNEYHIPVLCVGGGKGA